LKAFPAIERTVSCATFNKSSELFAYASSYEWSKGKENVQTGNDIFIHSVIAKNIQPNPKKSGG